MKRNLWRFFILLSAVCIFLVGKGTDAQELSDLATPEQALLTEESEKAKQVYTQIMHAVYLQSFDRDLGGARRLYDALVELTPNSAYVLFRRGQLRYRMQNVRGAEDDTRKALELNPSHVPATWQLAQILAHRAYYSGGKNVMEVLKTAKKVTELDPDHFMALQMLADLAFQLGEYTTAEAAYKSLTRIMPSEPNFHRGLGKLYNTLRQPQQAIDAYQRVVKIKPNDLEALRALGYLYLVPKKVAEAQQYFKRALTLEPQDIRSNLGMGLVLQELAQQALTSEDKNSQNESVDMSTIIRDAETYLGRAIYLSQDVINNTENQRRRFTYRKMATDARFALANVYFLFEKLEKAEDTFAQLLDDEPEHVGATYGIAAVYQTKEEFEKAETYLRKTLSLEPAHEYALNALGYLYAEQGTNLDEAEALVKRALKKSPTSGAYLDSLGWVFFKQGRIEEAVTTLESANEQSPNNVEILMHLGDAYLKNGEPEKARTVWQQAQTIEPDNDEIQERLKE